jgi:hypothetical protein
MLQTTPVKIRPLGRLIGSLLVAALTKSTLLRGGFISSIAISAGYSSPAISSGGFAYLAARHRRPAMRRGQRPAGFTDK